MRASHPSSVPRSRAWSSERDWARLITPRALKRERGALCGIAIGLATIALLSAIPALFLWIEFTH